MTEITLTPAVHHNACTIVQSVTARHWKMSIVDGIFLKLLNCTQYKCTTNNQHNESRK